MLVVDQDLNAPLAGAVVVIGGQLFQPRLGGAVLDPPVEVEDSRAIAVDQLAGAAQPVLHELVRGRGHAEQVVEVRLRHGGPVQIAAPQRFVDVAVEFPAVAHEEPVLDAVRRAADGHPAGLAGGLQLAQRVAAGAHLIGVVMGDVASVHLEAVVMLRHGHDVLRPGALEQRRPGVGVKLLRPEQGDEVLVAEFPVGAVGGDVVLVGLGAGHVHVAGVPLAVVGGHAVHAPVDEDAELGVPVPLRRAIVRQRFPAVGVGTLGNDLLDGGKAFFHGNLLWELGVRSEELVGGGRQNTQGRRTWRSVP